MTTTILVVDDEATIREVVGRYLSREGFEVREAADGFAALDELRFDPPDLIVLDLMLPGVDGLTITRQIRQGKHPNIPIIMLTAKGETKDRIRGLDIGADDYLAKPFSPRELVSRVNAVLRRVSEPIPAVEDTLNFAGLCIQPAARAVHAMEKPVKLSAKEFDLLYHFARNPRQVFTRTQLLDDVWGYEILWRRLNSDRPHPQTARED